NAAIEKVKSDGFKTLRVSEFDAYFYVGGSDKNVKYEELHNSAIRMISGLDFEMSPETIIRKQPSNLKYSTLISFHSVDSITISGGQLIGDKLHTIWGGKKSEWSQNISVISS